VLPSNSGSGRHYWREDPPFDLRHCSSLRATTSSNRHPVMALARWRILPLDAMTVRWRHYPNY